MHVRWGFICPDFAENIYKSCGRLIWSATAPPRFERRKCCYSSFLLPPFLADWGAPEGLGLALPGFSSYFSKKNFRKRAKKETLTAVEKTAVRLSPAQVPRAKAYPTTTMPVKN